MNTHRWLVVALVSLCTRLVLSSEDHRQITRNLRAVQEKKNVKPSASFSNIRKPFVIDHQETWQREDKSGEPTIKEISEHNLPLTKRDLRALLKRRRRKMSHLIGDDTKDELKSEKPPKKKKIVKCKDRAEDKCKHELEGAGTTIVHDIKGTKYFSVLVDEEEELTILALDDVEAVQDDPERFLSYIQEEEEEEESASSSHHRVLQQIVPAGVDLVRARELWERFGSKGEGVKVCVLDTGVRYTHEDFNQINMFGLTGNGIEFWVRTNLLILLNFLGKSTENHHRLIYEPSSFNCRMETDTGMELMCLVPLRQQRMTSELLVLPLGQRHAWLEVSSKRRGLFVWHSSTSPAF